MRRSHALGRLGWAASLTLWSLLLSVALVPVLMLSWTVDLRCEHATEEIRCVTKSYSVLHDSEETAATRGVRGARADTSYGGRRSRASSRRIMWETDMGEVHATPPNVDMLSHERWQSAARELDTFAKNPQAGPLSLALRSSLALQVGAAALLLLSLPLGIWLQGRHTVVEVDRLSRRITMRRQVFRFTLSETTLALGDVSSVISEPVRHGARLSFCLRQGQHIRLDRVAVRNAPADVAALNRLLLDQ